MGNTALFGGIAKPLRSLKPFPKWGAMMARHGVEQGCEVADPARYPMAAWAGLLDGLRDLDPLTQLSHVNRLMNRSRYIRDIVNWGVRDYWATPREFDAVRGDCEDYAIAKFYSLLALGYPGEDLRVLVVIDRNLKIGHAVLVAYHAGTAYVLDNQLKTVIRADRVRHYLPVYGVNAERAWRYRGGS